MLWAGDTRKRLLVNVSAYGGAVALCTVTAPGTQVLDRRLGGLSRWNRTAAARWREMHRAAAQRACRRGGVLTLIAWSWEYQRRGALHKHVLLGVETARERAGAHTYLLAIDELRAAYGFGFVDNGGSSKWRKRGLETIPAARAARYVAKYLSPLDADGKPTLSETVTREDVPPLVVYVARALTSWTGCTMRYLRFVRYAWVLGIDPATGEVLRPRYDTCTIAHVHSASCEPARGP